MKINRIDRHPMNMIECNVVLMTTNMKTLVRMQIISILLSQIDQLNDLGINQIYVNSTFYI